MALNLPVSIFRFDFQLNERPSLPVFAGSAWRGAFGHALKRTVCVVRETPCDACMLYRSCVFPYLFETPPPPDSARMRHYPAAPHPFVLGIEPKQAGLSYQLGLTLFGRAHQFLPYIVHALEKAGARGIGGKKQIFSLVSVAQAAPGDSPEWTTIYRPGQSLAAFPAAVPALPPVPGGLTVEIKTPLRLRSREHYVTPEGFRFADLFGALLRRISLLTYFHTDSPLEADFASLSEKSRSVRLIAPSLRWWDWTRYSSRQKTEMQMGGLLGSFGLDGAEIEDFWPYLWLGQWTLAGKAATMGLGRYAITAASLPSEAGDA